MISHIGYMHEHPDIEALLLRKGIELLNEEEFLRVVDLALANIPRASEIKYDKLAAAHILTGLEPDGIRELMRKGFHITKAAMQDPQAVLLAVSLDREKLGIQSSISADGSWMKGLSLYLKGSIRSENSAITVAVTIAQLIRTRFSNLLLVPFDDLDD